MSRRKDPVPRVATASAVIIASMLAGTGAASAVGGGGTDPGPDYTPPTITLTYPGSTWMDWYDADVPVKIDVADNVGGVGLRDFNWTISGAGSGTGSSTGTPATVTLGGQGRIQLDVEAFDYDGNRSTKEISVKVDHTPPEISWIPPWPNDTVVKKGTAGNFAYSCLDIDTGVMTCVAPIASGGSLPTDTVGPHAITVHAVNQLGEASDRTFTYTVANGPLAVVKAPAITGSVKVGSVLTVGGDQYDPAPDSVHYQWRRDGSDIAQAVGPHYTLRPEDRGTRLSVVATAHKAEWTDATLVSAPTGVVTIGDIVVTGVPTISGTPRLGSTLTTTQPTATPASATATYQWVRGFEVVGEGTSYTLGPDDVGSTILMRVVYQADGYMTRAAESDPTGPVTGALEVTAAPRIVGTTRVGQTLEARPAAFSPTPETVTYAWLRDGTPIPGATGSGYRLTGADVGHRVVVRVSAGLAGWESATTESVPSATVGRAVATGRATARVTHRTVRITVRLAAPGVAPTGKVTVRRGSTAVKGSWVVRKGIARIVLQRQPKGRYRYAIAYSGDAGVAGLRLRTARIVVR